MNGRVGGLQEFSVSLSPLGTFCVFELVNGVVWVGVLGSGTEGLGYNKQSIIFNI